MKRQWVNAPGVGVEAIDHQGNSVLFERIADAVNTIRRIGKYGDNAFKSTGVLKDILDLTGLNVNIKMNDAKYANAGIYVPRLNRNHVMYENYVRKWLDAETLDSAMSSKKMPKTAYVDRKNCRVSGMYSRLEVDMEVTAGLLKDVSYTDKGVAAIILHELGHLFTYYERLLDTVMMNYACASATQRILNIESQTERVEFLKSFDKREGIELDDKESIAHYQDGKVVYLRLVTESIRNRRSENGDEIYSLRNFEFSADQFAVRHGAGKELSIALAKLFDDGGAMPNRYMHTIIELFNFAGMVIAPVIMAIIGYAFPLVLAILILKFSNPMNKIYDDPYDRINRIKRDMLDRLKNREITKDERECILADLEQIDGIVSNGKDFKGWIECVHSYMLPGGRKARRAMEFQQQLERLSNNELFAVSATFRK